MTHFCLADTVDTAKTLLDFVGVPGEVVVDHQMAALKVHTFAGSVVGNEYHQIPVLHEPTNHLSAFFSRHAAVYDPWRHSLACLEPAAFLLSCRLGSSGCPWLQ